MKNPKAAGRLPVPSPAPVAITAPISETARNTAAGWDPYEVWRTRVLLPRVEDDAATPRAVDVPVPGGKPRLLKSA